MCTDYTSLFVEKRKSRNRNRPVISALLFVMTLLMASDWYPEASFVKPVVAGLCIHNEQYSGHHGSSYFDLGYYHNDNDRIREIRICSCSNHMGRLYLYMHHWSRGHNAGCCHRWYNTSFTGEIYHVRFYRHRDSTLNGFRYWVWHDNGGRSSYKGGTGSYYTYH